MTDDESEMKNNPELLSPGADQGEKSKGRKKL
jgi:hypothetical protein